MACSNVFLNKHFYIYGLGISNQKVIDYFIKEDINYTVINDENINKISKEDVVIKSPGIPSKDKVLKMLLDKEINIITDIELFYLLRPNLKYIGITGTCGKTTTCALLYNILKLKYKVEVCGNIGIPIFTYIDTTLDYLIVELSSYQLEYTNKFSPLFYIILNIYPHHINNHGTFENYLAAKLKPIYNLHKNQYLIINNEISPYLSDWNLNCKLITYSNDYKSCDVKISDNQIIYDTFNYPIEIYDYFKIDFNTLNFMSIVPILKELDISNQLINDAVKDFKQLNHRLEIIYESDNLIIINDSKSTSINSLYKAYKNILSLYPNYHLTIICGGKLDIDELNSSISYLQQIKYCKILIFGENRKYLKKYLVCETYENLLETISNIKLSGKDVILFSPGAQSLDQFNSYIERGITFKELIFNKLIK